MKPANDTRAEWWLAACITAAIAVLHFYFWRHAGALWRDEVNTVTLAQSPSWSLLTHDTFPILLPLLVKFWSLVAHSDEWLRLLGALLGLGIIAGFWGVALATRRPPLFSLVLFGLNLLLFYCGDSLRAYGLGSALIVLAMASLWFYLRQSSWPRAALFALAATLSVQTLFQNSVLVFALCLAAFAVCSRRKAWAAAVKVLCAGAAAALSLLPYWPRLAGLPQAAVELRVGFSFPLTQLNFEKATGFPFAGATAIWEALALLTVAFALLSLRSKPNNEANVDPDLPLFAGVALTASVGLYFVFLWLAAVGAKPWYFMPPLAIAAACFDSGIVLPALPRLVRVAVFAAVSGLALSAAWLITPELGRQLTNADRIADRLAATAAPQDFVIVTPWYYGMPFNRYFHGAAQWDTLPPLADHTLHRYDLVLDGMKDTNSLAPVLQKISTTLRAGHRVWIVGLLEWPPDLSETPPVLPPPPLPRYGWSDLPYMGSWAWRTSFYLAKHSEHFVPVPEANTGTRGLQEQLYLFSADGWRD
ncbi:MAG TPA: hypothetical protein VF988_15525 [Verrucomicrobiae bacterium]